MSAQIAIRAHVAGARRCSAISISPTLRTEGPFEGRLKK